MMSASTTNRRRRAVERAVKQSELKREAEKREAHIRSHTFALDTGAPITARIGEPVKLS